MHIQIYASRGEGQGKFVHIYMHPAPRGLIVERISVRLIIRDLFSRCTYVRTYVRVRHA